MQIELIATASEDSAYLPRLGLGTLAALTPKTDEVIYTDDLVKPFDLERDVKDVDLVGISVDSKTASRSYAIADAYRRRGVKVVLGGIHPTALPDEALRFADSVVLNDFLATPEGAGFATVGEPVLDPEILGTGAGIGIRKGDTALKEKFDAALAAIIASGEYKTINDKYIPVSILPK